MKTLERVQLRTWASHPVLNNRAEQVSLWIAQNEVGINPGLKPISLREKGRIKVWSVGFFAKELDIINDWWLIVSGTSSIPDLPHHFNRADITNRSLVAHPVDSGVIHVKIDNAGSARIHWQTPGEKRVPIDVAPTMAQHLKEPAEELARYFFSKAEEVCARHRITLTFARFSFAKRQSDSKLVPIGGLCDPDLAGLEFETKKIGDESSIIKLGRDEMKKAHQRGTPQLSDRIRNKWLAFQALLTSDL